MIRTININLNAAHPELPLVEATTFTGAPSSVFIRGVPKSVGSWSITAVSVAVTYPDNTTTARAAVESAEGVWVATIPGTATSGRTTAGFKIVADGIDENGAAVTGYVLGFADFSVLSFFPVPAPGETFYILRYFDTMPTAAKKMDVTTIDGILKYYNGTTWLPFADLTEYAKRAELFPAWAANTAYTTYSLVIHENAVYKCTTAHTSGAEWDSTKWAVATGAEVLGVLLDYNALSNKPTIPDISGKADSSSIAAVFDASKQGGYAVGDVVMYNGARYRCTTSHTGAWDAAHFEAQTVEAAKANDNAVVKLNSESQQTVHTLLQLMNTLYAEGGIESHDDIRLVWSEYGDYAGTLTISKDKISVQLANEQSARQYGFQTGGGGTVALLQNIAPEFVYQQSYAAGELCVSYDADTNHLGYWLYKCILATDGSTTPEMDSTHWALATVEDVLAALRTAIAGKAPLASPAFTGTPTAPTPTASDSTTKLATTAFVQGAVPYALGTVQTISTASQDTSGAETIDYGSATMLDRTGNYVAITTALDELRVTFPSIVNGKMRDFLLRVEVGTGSAALTAPALVAVAPTGETITLENPDGEMPTIVDGTATAKGVTYLLFSESAVAGKFVVRGIELKEVA